MNGTETKNSSRPRGEHQPLQRLTIYMAPETCSQAVAQATEHGLDLSSYLSWLIEHDQQAAIQTGPRPN